MLLVRAVASSCVSAAIHIWNTNVRGILYIIGSAMNASKSKCVKSGCNNERSSGSAYCFLHKPYENSSYKNSYSRTTRTTIESTTEVTIKTTEIATISVTTMEEPTTRAWKNNVSYKNNTSGNPYKSYDDGYDDMCTWTGIMMMTDITEIRITLMVWTML